MSGIQRVERDGGNEIDPALAGGGSEHSDVEAQARRMGWVPKEDFRGDVNNWRPAEEFLDRGMNLLPVLQQQYRSLEGKHTKLESLYSDSQRSLADITDRMRKADERAYKRAMRDLEAQRAQAVQNGDTQAFNAVEAEINELRDTAQPAPADRGNQGGAPAGRQPAEAARQPAAQPGQVVVPPEVQNWVRDNSWFETNAEARADAIAIQTSIDQQYPHLSLTERLSKTRQKVSQMHPALFENPRRSAPPAVGGSTPSGGRGAPNPRSFDAMPQDSKDAFTRYVKALDGKGKPLTKEEWAENYWEND